MSSSAFNIFAEDEIQNSGDVDACPPHHAAESLMKEHHLIKDIVTKTIMRNECLRKMD